MCGGGTLIDRAKATAKRRPEPVRVVAVPTLWGAGAEASPVIVLNGSDGVKEIAIDDAFLPDARVVWPEPSATAPTALRRAGAGDVWAHTLEALISPLAGDSIREDAAALVHELLPLTPGGEHATTWLDLSARACALQSRASVGLAHGIAHQLEGSWHRSCACGRRRTAERLRRSPLRRRRAGKMSPLRTSSTPSGSLRGLPRPGRPRRPLGDTRTALSEYWRAILRDPMTRTNGFLVRPAHLDAFSGVAA